jgi:hypothetical protein
MAGLCARRAASYLTRVGLLLTTLISAASASAQPSDEPLERARLHVGPLGLTPSVALTGFGIDTNVFNEFEDSKSDFTFTLSPQLDTWLRAGRSRLHVAGRSDLVYFHRYASERSVDGAVETRLEIRSSRVTPWFTGAFSSGRQRFGYEVDLRFRRTSRELGAGLDARVTARTRAGVWARQSTYTHEEDAVYLGSRLRDALDRRTEALGADVRYALTPLTTVVLSAEGARDRFEYSPARDADSWRMTAGFDLSRFALIGGSGRVGYRRFVGVGGGLPTYSGIVASVAATTTFRGRTHLEISSERDVNYSWEYLYPYFVLTGATITATPQLTPRWDVRGRAGVHRLAYRAAIGMPDLLPERVDRFEVFGAGIGYRIASGVRFGVMLDRERRVSPLRVRAYEGYRTGLTVTYGR